MIQQLLASSDREMIELGISIISQTKGINETLEEVKKHLNNKYRVYIEDPLNDPKISLQEATERNLWVKDPTKLLKLKPNAPK